MRLRAKVDANQKEIVDIIRAHYFYVRLMHDVGKGFPDAIVARQKEAWFVEIKDGEKAKFTPAQKEFYLEWPGPDIIAIRSVDDAYSFCANPTLYAHNNSVNTILQKKEK